jgi:hypothetical protein
MMTAFSLLLVVFLLAGVSACDKVYIFTAGGLPAAAITNINDAINLANTDGANLCWNTADTTFDETTLVTVLNQGMVNFLIALNVDITMPIWSAATKTAVSNALSDNKLQKLAVFDEFTEDDAGIPGLEAGQIVKDADSGFMDPVSPLD